MYLIDLLRLIDDNTTVVITDNNGKTITRNAMKNKIDKRYYNHEVLAVSLWYDESLGDYINITIYEYL